MTLLIFDCDGVLVDSEMIAHAAMAELMSALSRPMTTQEALGIFAGRRLRDALAAAEALLSAPIPHDVGVAAGQRLLERFRRELKPVEGVRQAIEALPYARCVASSSTPERLRVSLDVTGLAPLFGDNVFSADQVANGKPAADLFLFAARSLDAPPAGVSRPAGSWPAPRKVRSKSAYDMASGRTSGSGLRSATRVTAPTITNKIPRTPRIARMSRCPVMAPTRMRRTPRPTSPGATCTGTVSTSAQTP